MAGRDWTGRERAGRPGETGRSGRPGGIGPSERLSGREKKVRPGVTGPGGRAPDQDIREPAQKNREEGRAVICRPQQVKKPAVPPRPLTNSCGFVLGPPPAAAKKAGKLAVGLALQAAAPPVTGTSQRPNHPIFRGNEHTTTFSTLVRTSRACLNWRSRSKSSWQHVVEVGNATNSTRSSEGTSATMDGRRGGVALFRLPSTSQRQKPEPPPSAWGIGLIVLGVLLLVIFVYTAIVSKMLPPSGIYLLDALRDDWYYNLLVPLTIPTMVVAVYLHWLSMKLFKHA